MRRLIAGFFAMTLVALLLGILALTLLRATLRRHEQLVREYLGEVVLAEELVSVSNQAARKARDYLLTADASHLRELEVARKRFLELHEAMGAAEHVRPEERELLSRLRTLWFTAGASANRAMESRERTGRVVGETERIVEQEMLPDRNRFDAELEALLRYERTLYEKARQQADTAAERAWRLLAAGFLGAVAASLVLGALLRRALRQRERAEAERTSLLAREREARRQAEEALVQLDNLVDTAPVGMAFLDTALRFVRINRVLADVNGLSMEAHFGRALSEVLPALAPTLEPLYRRALAGEYVLEQEVSGPNPAREGEEGHWLASYYPVRNAEGHVFMAGSVVVDISERKRAEQELQRTAQFRERLIGIVSHDLRTPLTAVSAGASLLLRTEGVPEKALRTVGRISTSAERMARMISELLDFTRVRLGGGIPVQRTASDLYPVVRHAVEEAEMAFPDRPVRLEAQGHFRGEWDEGRLAQVVGNLLKNALTYSPEDTPVRVSLHDEGPWVRLEVHNPNRAGPIPPETLPTLFDPFRRGEASHTEGAREGLGLGLYIAREIVSAHGGFIDVMSSAQEGTVFTLRLPRERAVAAAAR
ncbi:ATP-binding protein [Archangium sp.]|uniref:sensor histidine kinase n=1 Tax=Archangium sp. TaxID=1872627 RepID=UPI00286B4EEE|nr:ATP-binding protein [Archangium sp.]